METGGLHGLLGGNGELDFDAGEAGCDKEKGGGRKIWEKM